MTFSRLMSTVRRKASVKLVASDHRCKTHRISYHPWEAPPSSSFQPTSAKKRVVIVKVKIMDARPCLPSQKTSFRMATQMV